MEDTTTAHEETQTEEVTSEEDFQEGLENTLELPDDVKEIMKRFYRKGIQYKKKHDLSRNESCHCGSKKKYKKCCLRKDSEDKYEELYHHGFFEQS